MKILILAAMQKEVALILQHLDRAAQEESGGVSYYKGVMGEKKVLLAQCGIGKVNSALRAQRLIDMFHPDLVINSGVAGGVDASMKIGSVLVADTAGYHDVWCGPGTAEGEADGCPALFRPDQTVLRLLADISDERKEPLRFGLIASGDRFISTPEEVKRIKSVYPEALGCDMESASIAHTCWLNGVSFAVIRVMSDMPGGGSNIAEYENFWDEAPARTFDVLSRLIERL